MIKDILQTAIKEINEELGDYFLKQYKFTYLTELEIEKMAEKMHFYLIEQFDLNPFDFSKKIDIKVNSLGEVSISGVSHYIKAAIRG